MPGCRAARAVHFCQGVADVRAFRGSSARSRGRAQVLGIAIGKCAKEKLFKGYIELELQLGNIERCRTLYNKYLSPTTQLCCVAEVCRT